MIVYKNKARKILLILLQISEAMGEMTSRSVPAVAGGVVRADLGLVFEIRPRDGA